MRRTEVAVEGVLTEDGKLIFDEKPNLPAGRVAGLLRPAPALTEAGETMFDVLERIWARQDARGFKGRTLQEAVEEVRALRDEFDRRLDDLDEYRRTGRYPER